MADVRNTDLGGSTNFGEEGLKPSEANATFSAAAVKLYADNTGGTIVNSTTETDLATITITQNDLGSSGSIKVDTGGFYVGSGHGILRIYVGGSVKKTVNLTNAVISAVETGTGLTYIETGLDTTAGNVIVKITGQNSSAVANEGTFVPSLAVTGYRY